MRNYRNLFLIFLLILAVFFLKDKQLPQFSQEFVEDYVSNYSKDFSFLEKKSYSLGLNGLIESSETDWYFHDNELDFDFHVKTLKSQYPPKAKHISCNYYASYVKKFLTLNGSRLNQEMTDIFSEIYNIEKINIFYYRDANQIRILIDGEKNANFSNSRLEELNKKAFIQLCTCIEQYDPNFINRTKYDGCDLYFDTDTSWFDKGDFLKVMIEHNIFEINSYYEQTESCS